MYHRRSLPGRFSVLHMHRLLFVAFKVIAPGQEVGFDLSKEYALALDMKRDKRDNP
jgi:hypothetical protein